MAKESGPRGPFDRPRWQYVAQVVGLLAMVAGLTFRTSWVVGLGLVVILLGITDHHPWSAAERRNATRLLSGVAFLAGVGFLFANSAANSVANAFGERSGTGVFVVAALGMIAVGIALFVVSFWFEDDD